MSSTSHKENHNEHGSAKPYILGFVLSIIFSIIPFVLVQYDLLSKIALIFVILIFAGLQLFIQLVFFMHLNEEKKPRLFSQAFWFAIISLLIIVGGTFWVMYELDYYMMGAM